MQKFDVVSGYIADALSPDTRHAIIEDAVVKLTPVADEFDAVAFQGMSGAVIAPIIAHMLGKGIIVVRQEPGAGGRSHSAREVEGPCGSLRFLIVDDFICTGNTIKRIHSMVTTFNPQAVCAGIYLWRGDYCDQQDYRVGEFLVPLHASLRSNTLYEEGRIFDSWTQPRYCADCR